MTSAFLSGQRLTADELNLAVFRPYVHTYQTATQTLANGTATAITFTAEIIDTINCHSNSSNTSRYTPNVPGYYHCWGMVIFAANTTGDRTCHFRKNGSALLGAPYGAIPAMNGTGFVAGCALCEATISCNGSTDYIELFGVQNSGGNLDTAVSSGNTASTMIIQRVAPNS